MLIMKLGATLNFFIRVVYHTTSLGQSNVPTGSEGFPHRVRGSGTMSMLNLVLREFECRHHI
jgi:hypothetical protein